LPVALVVASCSGGTPGADGTTTIAGQSGTSVVTTIAPITTTTVSDRDAALQGTIDQWSVDVGPVGVAAAVLFPDGSVWTGAAGLADRSAGIGVDPDGRFEIGSVTKTFMAVLTLRLAEEGIVDLDAPIEALLPDFPSSDVITIRQLLGHRAGVHDPSAELVNDSDGPPDPERVFTPEELLAASAVGSPEFQPGTRQNYSNAGYWVLAATLEAATGESMSFLLDEYIFGPLDLNDTLLFDSSLPSVEVVNAYSDLDLDGTEDAMGTLPLPGYVTPAWTAGAIISTAPDLVAFLSAVFDGGFLSPDSLEALTDTSAGSGSYALGIYRLGVAWGHDGAIKGYLSALFHDKTTGVTVAVLTNRFGPRAPQADALAPRLLAEAKRYVGG